MERFWLGLLLAAFTLTSTWTHVGANADQSLLASLLPKKTFVITHTRFDVGGGGVASAPMRNGRPRPTGIFGVRYPYRYAERKPTVQTNVRTPIVSQRHVAPYQQTLTVPQPSRGIQQQQQPQPSFQPVAPPQGSAVTQVPSRRHRHCGVLPPAGGCRAAFPRYYYNNRTDQCDCFLYGGCGAMGLEYSYRNLEECQSMCCPSNLEEGPVCKEIFQEEDVFFDAPHSDTPNHENSYPSPSSSIQLPLDDELLTLLVNSVSPDDLVSPNNNRQGTNSHNGRRPTTNY